MWHKSFIPNHVPLLTSINSCYRFSLVFLGKYKFISVLFCTLSFPGNTVVKKKARFTHCCQSIPYDSRGIIKPYLPQIFSLWVWSQNQNLPLKAYINYKTCKTGIFFYQRITDPPVRRKALLLILALQHLGNIEFSGLWVYTLEAPKQFPEVWWAMKTVDFSEGSGNSWFQWEIKKQGKD